MSKQQQVRKVVRGISIRSRYSILPKIFNSSVRGAKEEYCLTHNQAKKQGTETAFEKSQIPDLTRQRLQNNHQKIHSKAKVNHA